jgi:acyl carrier protein
MGLDVVELVMAIESHFGIEIPDADAERLEIAGDLSDYIVEVLERQRGERVDPEEVWEQVVMLTVEQLGVHPEEVTRTASFVNDLGAD